MNSKEQTKHTNNLTYFFIFGNNPALSLAEIKQFIPSDAEYVLSNKFLIVTLGKKIDAEQLIDTLGGTVKVGRILGEELDNNLKSYSKKILPFFNPQDKENKYYYGFSVYGNVNSQTEKQILELGMTIKKELRSRDIKCRFVTSKEPVLSSVIVQKNKLVSNQGVELCFLQINGKTYIGKTLVVQDFKTQSSLDYDRPAFDSKSGMVPPKLARMMVNLARKQNNNDQPVLLDPFCGSGTVLQEAFLVGIKQAIGTDLSSKAVNDSNTNLKWLKETTKLNFDFKIWQNDVVAISQKIAPESVDLIVTEPFLGPPQTGSEIPQMITKIREELSDLYSKALVEFQKILKKGGVVCMIWPIFTSGETQQFLPIYDQLAKNNFKIIKILTSEDKKNLSLENQERGELVYKREGQKVLREIVIFKK